MTVDARVITTDLTDDEFRAVLRKWFADNPAPELPELHHIGDDADAEYLAAPDDEIARSRLPEEPSPRFQDRKVVGDRNGERRVVAPGRGRQPDEKAGRRAQRHDGQGFR